MPEKKTVLISGAGPVGLFCALLLATEGVFVRIFDLHKELQDDPRAATTHPATLEVLGSAGLVEEMKSVGLVAPIFQFWDRPTGSLIATFDLSALADDTDYPFVVQCEQFKTSKILLRRLLKMPNVEVLFGHKVLRCSQESNKATVDVETQQGIKTYSGDWLIGADGARSVIRKEAKIDFEGFTWPERFLVLTTPFDFNQELGYCPRSYFADPDEWCNCFKVAADGPPGLWRLVFPADANVPEESLLTDDAVHSRMQKFFPRSQKYDVVHRNIYTVHQRVASTFRKGRILLAGDSAHVNNSIGGMGLNGGLQDAASLAGKLVQVLNGASDSLMDLYSLQRRTVSIEFVQAQTIANKKQLELKDPEERNRMFDELSSTAEDKEKAREYLLRTSMISLQRRAESIQL